MITNIVPGDVGDSPVVPLPGDNEPPRPGLDYADGRTLQELNDFAYEATDTAYARAQRPGMTIRIGRIDDEHIGALIFFFELATAIEGLLMAINPMDQPGVQAYKDFLGGLLGRACYESFDAEYRTWRGSRRDYTL